MTELSDADRFDYQLLSRLQQDCEYYLGFGARNKKHLWAQGESEQIQKMKELYAGLPEKPEWLTLADIEKYESAMVGPGQAALLPEDGTVGGLMGWMVRYVKDRFPNNPIVHWSEGRRGPQDIDPAAAMPRPGSQPGDLSHIACFVRRGDHGCPSVEVGAMLRDGQFKSLAIGQGDAGSDAQCWEVARTISVVLEGIIFRNEMAQASELGERREAPVFVECEESNLGLLGSLGACVVSAYDHERRGVEAVVSGDARVELAAFPADFKVREPSGTKSSPVASRDKLLTVFAGLFGDVRAMVSAADRGEVWVTNIGTRARIEMAEAIFSLESPAAAAKAPDAALEP